MKFEKRLELLKDKVMEDDFLKGKGLGNEVPFWIFDYPTEKELVVRQTIDKLLERLDNQGIPIIKIDLYELCLNILDNKVGLDRIISLESEKGSNELHKKIQLLMKPAILIQEIKQLITQQEYQLVFLCGVGKVWPLVRSHNVLNNLQAVVRDEVVVVLFYPGEYSGNDLNLFNKCFEGNYYRAFRLIDI